MKILEFKGKKAQAAMEFLTTYGWAVLIIALVLVAIAWLGIFNVPGQVPDRCAFPTGTFICNDAVVSLGTTGIELDRITLTNKFGKTVMVCGIACSAQPPLPETGLPQGVISRTNANCVIKVNGVDAFITSYADSKLTLSLGPAPECTDAAGRADSYAVGSRYTGTLYIQYLNPGDTGTARIVTGDLVATVQSA